MVGMFRPRRFASVALLGALALGLAACSTVYPNTTFGHNSDYNASIDALWDKLLFLGTIVFVGVEVALIYVIFRYRRRPDSPQPKPVHGSTTLEIAWTIIPALVLIVVAIPTVKTIFRTQAKAPADALQVEAIGHQWWWEFRYPQYNIVTANELYLPIGRTVSFQLKTVDVLHSFWIPAMGGKRDLVTNRINYMWFTPDDSLPSMAVNGACAEFCGTSHANMRFRTYLVKLAEFEMWRKNQETEPAFTGVVPPPPPAAPAPVKGAKVAAKPDSAAAAVAPVVADRPPVWMFPADQIEAKFGYTIPKTPIPGDSVGTGALNGFDDALLANGDATRGKNSAGVCLACHQFSTKIMPGFSPLAPNLAHIASRHTIGAGLYPNDARHLARWIKNSGHMKPGSKMYPIGKGQMDVNTGKVSTMGMYTDAQIADIVAYLQVLK
ncbi:MAG: cytochrome c oxidase subunit II [Gemmatimonas sp.]